MMEWKSETKNYKSAKLCKCTRQARKQQINKGKRKCQECLSGDSLKKNKYKQASVKKRKRKNLEIHVIFDFILTNDLIAYFRHDR